MFFNELIHQPVRLRLMSMLTAQPSRRLEFPELRRTLGLTDGNLGAHLGRLEGAGYLTLHKRFVSRKPHTFVIATDAGREAFAEHVEALADLLAPSP